MGLRHLPLALTVLASPCWARTLSVGPGQQYPSFYDAIQATSDGDTVLIQPGSYFECAVIGRSHLTIAGAAPGVVITDKACQGKALLVIDGEDVTIRNLTLARARVPDGNGAGIRLEAKDLTVDGVTFDNDTVGILAGSVGGTVTIENSRFQDGGIGGDQLKFAVMMGQVDKLRIAHTTFAGVKGGQVTTYADRTELIGNQIGEGSGDEPEVAVLATRGDLLAEDNTFQIGPNAPNLGAAIAAWDAATVTLRRNQLENKTGQHLALLLDWTNSSPVLEGNQVGPGDSEVSTSGLWRHRASGTFAATKEAVRDLARSVKHLLVR